MDPMIEAMVEFNEACIKLSDAFCYDKNPPTEIAGELQKQLARKIRSFTVVIDRLIDTRNRMVERGIV